LSDIRNETGESAPHGGILITSPDGTIYDIPLEDLKQFRVPDDKVDEVIRRAEHAGLHPQGPEERGQMAPVGDLQPRTVINIFVGSGGQEAQVNLPEGDECVGSSMSKYAAGSTMSKYAAGSTMSKYAAGSTMSKYAAGSTMSKYAAGSTPAFSSATTGIAGPPAAIFYGSWER
jgi:hypothetical protein